MGKKLNILGLKFGHLTAIEKMGTHPTQRTILWKWRCDCGNEREIEARRVVSGHTRTCGKCQLKHKLMVETTQSKSAQNKRLTREFQKYIRRAQRRKLKWALSLNEFGQLATADCSLCGEPMGSTQYNCVEPALHREGYASGGCYTRCPDCDMAFSKSDISLIITQIMETYKHLIASRSK